MSATNSWLRLWHDMPNDPKWRTIARVSKQPASLVIAVYLHVLVDASTNASERGRTHSLCVEDVATALDVDDQQVQDILDAMQGRLMDGDLVTGWEKRQPKREDGSAQRAKKWRERQKQQKNDEVNADQTHANATERTSNAGKRPDADADKETDTENPPLPPRRFDGVEPVPLPPEEGGGIPPHPNPTPTPAGLICRRLKSEALIADVNPSHPRLIALLEAGADWPEFASAAQAAQGKSRPFAYVLSVVEGERRRAAEMSGAIHHGRMPNKQQAIENRNRNVADEWLHGAVA